MGITTKTPFAYLSHIIDPCWRFCNRTARGKMRFINHLKQTSDKTTTTPQKKINNKKTPLHNSYSPHASFRKSQSVFIDWFVQKLVIVDQTKHHIIGVQQLSFCVSLMRKCLPTLPLLNVGYADVHFEAVTELRLQSLLCVQSTTCLALWYPLTPFHWLILFRKGGYYWPALWSRYRTAPSVVAVCPAHAACLAPWCQCVCIAHPPPPYCIQTKRHVRG